MTSTTTASRSEIHRDPPTGAWASARWLSDPISPQGVTWAHRARFALNGPEAP